jgi:beta propeller repeat protein
VTTLALGTVEAQHNAASISGTRVTWTDFTTCSIPSGSGGQFNVILYDLASGGPALPLTNDACDGNQNFLSDIDGELVTFIHSGPFGPGDIVLYGPKSKGLINVAASNNVSLNFSRPAIGGNGPSNLPYVVFERETSRIDIDSYSVALGFGGLLTGADQAGLHLRPRISGDLVVYEQHDGCRPASDLQCDHNGIFAYQISTKGPPLSISNYDSADKETSDVKGTKVVWVQSPSGASIHTGQDQIFSYDFGTHSIQQLTTVSSSKTQPRVSGSRVVWSDDRNGADDLYVYDFATGRESPLVTGPGDKTQPNIDGDRVVFTYKEPTSALLSVDLFTFASTTTALATSLNPSMFGQPVTLTAPSPQSASRPLAAAHWGRSTSGMGPLTSDKPP